MSALTGEQLGRLLLDALGIDKTAVHSIRIGCVPNTAATVEIERWVRGEEGDRVAAVLTRYELHEAHADARETTAIGDSAKHYSRNHKPLEAA